MNWGGGVRSVVDGVILTPLDAMLSVAKLAVLLEGKEGVGYGS